ncbi:MAG: VOC family protein [Solirubrobacteraceae bacterium]|nr:VOC family protein [Solirubrobacteraceae bacterium]
MAIEGLHHVTAITADAPGNLDFYVGVLGLRLVKKTVNFDEPSVYHLYYGDEVGAPGSILTFFEFPGAAPGRAGDGMVHTIRWRVGSDAAIGFWHERLAGAGVPVDRDVDALLFRDPEGLSHELLVAGGRDAPLAAHAPDVPDEHALQGFHGVRAYAALPDRGRPLLSALGMQPEDDRGEDWTAAGAERRAHLRYDRPPTERGVPGAGTVHHIAWSVADDAELLALRERAGAAGARATPIVDRQYFHSVYFREPSGVLFELASRDIGFTFDEPVASLGSTLKLPPQHEHMRAAVEQSLTPLPDPRRRSDAPAR